MVFDTVIRNGRVVDGTGGPWFPADIGLLGGRIAAVGRLNGAVAGQELDARDLIVAPGFIDIHDHSDFTLLADPLAKSAIHQGVTTIVPGNCGFSAAPLVDPAAQRHALFGYVNEGEITWRTFADFLDRLRHAHPSINVAPLVGHSAIRSSVMGLAARGPTADEQRRMEQLLRESLNAGAFGLSIGLEYVPSQYAGVHELAGLARIVQGYGRLFAAHVRSRDFRYIQAVDEVLVAAESAGVATQLSHLTARYGALRDADQTVWQRIEQARDRGLDVTCDQHPFTTSNATAVSILPPEAFTGSIETIRRRLADPSVRARFKAYRAPQNKLILAGQWDLITIVAAPHSPELLGRPLDEVAAERDCDPYDVIFDAMLAELAEGNDLMGVRLQAEKYIDETVLRDALTHPLFMFASDGQVLSPEGPLANVRNPYSYGWVARILGTYSRERGWFRLEEAVRKLTSFPARKLGLTDRGLIHPGMAADLAIFDPAIVCANDTALDPSQYPNGVHYVFVNGVQTLNGHCHTGARAGCLLQPA